MSISKILINGKKYHLLAEVLDGDSIFLAVKIYDHSKKIWIHELKPKKLIKE
ncbi:MAG: hypothetical protein ACRDCA_12495 [Serratia sp. (in: enterobacteria)]|uniref:hypothetical protein n=1 Tax=Serratia sp. (in: enterobacteria) TaxID=616 RepID=UPI003F36D9DB